MAKVVQPLLVVAAIAVNVIPGVGQVLSAAMITAITTAGITAGIGIASSALGLGPKSPQVNAATRDRLYASIDPATYRKMVFGTTALATDIRYEEWNGNDQEYLDRILCAASHRVTGFDEIWFDDKLAWTAAGGAQGTFAGYLTITPVLEGNAGNFVVIGNGSKWGANRRMTGLAYLRMRFKVTGNGKKKESPFAQSIPSRITVIGRACPVYDPRFDSTRGGSGTMRADDQATWAFSYGGYEIGRNPSLQLLAYLLGWRINGKLAVGRGIPVERIDFDSFITAANACDEPVARVSGGNEPRYRADGIFSEGDDARGVVSTYEATMNAKLRDAGGRYTLTVISNDLAAPRFDFTDDDVLGGFRWEATPEIDKTFNEIRGKFTNPDRAALYQLVDYPRYRQTPIDGVERVHPFDLPMVQSASQAQRLAKQQFARNQYQGQFQCQLGQRGWAVQLGDVVTLTFSALGWDKRLFRVIEHGIRPDGVCPIVLQEENAAIYLWDKDERPDVAPVQPVPYDPTKSVLFQLLVAGEIDYANGDSLEYLKPLTENATWGAPDGTTIGGTINPDGSVSGGRPVVDVLQEIDDLIDTYGGTIAAGEAAAAAAAARDAAILAQQNAQTARDQAQAARSGAEGARLDALGAATAAGLSQSAASGSAIAAGSSAGAASVSAGQAATSATDASGSASSAATSAATAASTYTRVIEATGNEQFANGVDGWDGMTGAVGVASSGGRASVVRLRTGSLTIIQGRKVPVNSDAARFRLSAAWRAYGADGRYFAGAIFYDGAGNPIAGTDGTGNYPLAAYSLVTVAGGWVDRTIVIGRGVVAASPYGGTRNIPVGAAYFRPVLFANYDNVAANYTEVDYFTVADVTAEESAGVYASAASTSATSAAASETAAGQSASAASGSANTASTRAGEALTYRNDAATSASNAAGSASTASTQAGLSATSAGGAAGSASAANTSAGIASTKAGEAGASATAANTARVAAEVARDGAVSSASSASGSASSASGSASSALDYRNTTATYRDQAAGSASAANLSAQAASSAAASVDADVGAISQRVDTVEATANQAYASAGTSADAIALLNGYAASRWQASAQTIGGRAQISVYSSVNGGAGVDIVGDTRFRGQLFIGMDQSANVVQITNQSIKILGPAGIAHFEVGFQ